MSAVKLKQNSLFGDVIEDEASKPVPAPKTFFDDIAQVAESLNGKPTIDPSNKVTGKYIIVGKIPAKSNLYKIITMKPKKGSDKKPHSSLAKSDILLEYEKSFAYQWRPMKCPPIQGQFRLTVDVYFHWMRSDLDNSMKILLDCLQASGSIENDNMCMEIVARKMIDKQNPRIEFSLKKLSLHDSSRNEERSEIQGKCRPCPAFIGYHTIH